MEHWYIQARKYPRWFNRSYTWDCANNPVSPMILDQCESMEQKNAVCKLVFPSNFGSISTILPGITQITPTKTNLNTNFCIWSDKNLDKLCLAGVFYHFNMVWSEYGVKLWSLTWVLECRVASWLYDARIPNPLERMHIASNISCCTIETIFDVRFQLDESKIEPNFKLG